MFGDSIRRTGFWVLDAIRGGEIQKNYIDIKRKMESNQLNEEQLHKLMEYATKTAPFYHDLKPNDFQSFPVITKNDIKSQWDQMHSSVFHGKPVHYIFTRS